MTLTLRHFMRALFLLSGLFIMVSTSALAQAEHQSEMADFDIYIKYDDVEVRMICKSGCSWKELGFDLKDINDPQYINQNGMTTVDNSNGSAVDGSPGFHFAISRDKEKGGLRCMSKSGTAWNELGFKANSFIGSKWSLIDESGVEVGVNFSGAK